jgi:imidazolonepropionase-like amidohydrolase
MNKFFRIIIFWGITQFSIMGQDTTFIFCGNLIDGFSNSSQGASTIVIYKDKILEVKKGFFPKENGVKSQVLDWKEYTVLPGFIDMHVHLEFEGSKYSYIQQFADEEADIAFKSKIYAEKTLRAGFTSVRDLGGSGVNSSLKRAIQLGYTYGPRIFSAGKAISITGGHGDPTNGVKRDLYEMPTTKNGVADGPEECMKAVREQIKRGADWIKITATGGVLSLARDGKRPAFSVEEMKAIVETANDMGIQVAAHAHGDEGMRRAVLAGVKTIEHGTFMSDETMRIMKEKNCYYVPTITAGKSVADSALRSPGFYTEMVAEKAKEIGPKIQATCAKAYKMGVPMCFGTDAGVFPHGKNGMEFNYMVEAGILPMEVIKMATSINAKVLEMDGKIGAIKPGAFADFVAVKGNPLKDIRILEKPNYVMKGGTVISN